MVNEVLRHIGMIDQDCVDIMTAKSARTCFSWQCLTVGAPVWMEGKH